MSFREDGTGRARVGGALPRARRRLPGTGAGRARRLRGQLPPSPPEDGEPFSALLEDMDGDPARRSTHWQHPRFFAYFSNTRSEPAILAELLSATLNQVAILWRTSPALDGARGARHSAGSRSCSGCPRAGTATSRTPRRPPRSTALAAARARNARPAVRRLLRARALVDRQGRSHPRARAAARRRSTTSSGCGPIALDLGGACAVVATVGTTSTTSADPVDGDRRPARGEVWLHVDAAYAARPGSAPSSAGPPAAGSSAPTRSSSTHTSGCSRRWTARCLWTPRAGGVPAGLQPRARVPATLRGRRQPERVGIRARPARFGR